MYNGTICQNKTFLSKIDENIERFSYSMGISIPISFTQKYLLADFLDIPILLRRSLGIVSYILCIGRHYGWSKRDKCSKK